SKRDWSSDVCSSDLLPFEHGSPIGTRLEACSDARTVFESESSGRRRGASASNASGGLMAISRGGGVRAGSPARWCRGSRAVRRRSEERRVGKGGATG